MFVSIHISWTIIESRISQFIASRIPTPGLHTHTHTHPQINSSIPFSFFFNDTNNHELFCTLWVLIHLFNHKDNPNTCRKLDWCIDIQTHASWCNVFDQCYSGSNKWHYPKKFCASTGSRTPVSRYPGKHHTTRLPRTLHRCHILPSKKKGCPHAFQAWRSHWPPNVTVNTRINDIANTVWNTVIKSTLEKK